MKRVEDNGSWSLFCPCEVCFDIDIYIYSKWTSAHARKRDLSVDIYGKCAHSDICTHVYLHTTDLHT